MMCEKSNANLPVVVQVLLCFRKISVSEGELLSPNLPLSKIPHLPFLKCSLFNEEISVTLWLSITQSPVDQSKTITANHRQLYGTEPPLGEMDYLIHIVRGF